MDITQLHTNTISNEAFEWLQKKYIAVDSMNMTGYSNFIAEECTLQFGNSPLVKGKNAMLQGIGSFWQTINGLHHHFLNILGSDDHFAAEALIYYTRKDKRVVYIPCVTTIQRNSEGKAISLKIFIDVNPIYA
jgi:hypothetical protein